MSKIKYGMIGFGGIAENRIAKEGFGLDLSRFEGNPGAELVAVTDINPDRRTAVEGLNLKWYENADRLLEDRSIEAVVVATNNSGHFELAKKVIESGRNCFIEKPVTTRIEEAKILRRLAVEKNVSLTVDHMMKKNSFNVLAKEALGNKMIGEVNDITLHMEFSYGGTEDEAKSWRCSVPEELGGPIGDVGSHCFYMAEFLLDDVISEVACVMTPATFKIAVENGAVISFRTEKGYEGTVNVSFNKRRGGLVGTLSNLGFEVYGSEGVIRSYGTLFQLSGHGDEAFKIRLEAETSGGVKTLVPEKIENIYQQQIIDHADSIKDGNLHDGSEAVHNLETIFACFESVKNNSGFIKI